MTSTIEELYGFDGLPSSPVKDYYAASPHPSAIPIPTPRQPHFAQQSSASTSPGRPAAVAAYFYNPGIVISNQHTHFSTNHYAAMHCDDPTLALLAAMPATRAAPAMFPNQFRYVSQTTPDPLVLPVEFKPESPVVVVQSGGALGAADLDARCRRAVQYVCSDMTGPVAWDVVTKQYGVGRSDVAYYMEQTHFGKSR